MGHPSESSILGYIDAESKDELAHFYLYRVFRNEFHEEDMCAPAQIVNSHLIHIRTRKSIRFVGRADDNGRLFDYCSVAPTEGEVYTSTGGLMSVWFAEPNPELAKKIFSKIYLKKREDLQKRLDACDKILDLLGE